MQARLRFLLTACFLLAGSVVAQHTAPCDSPWPLPCKPDANLDLASLVPAHTLVYLQLHQPDKLVEEVRELLRGSPLEEPGPLVSRLRRSKEDRTTQALLCNFLAPEVLNEVAGYDGGLLALTGLTRDGTPQIVAVLKTGNGGMASLAMRYYQASSDDIEVVGQVKGSNIYRVGTLRIDSLQKRQTRAKHSTEDAPGRGKKHKGGVFLAQVPEAIVAGSTQAAVEDVLHRLRAENRTPSLADMEAFQEAASLRTGPGLFVYADAARLFRLAKIMKMPEGSEDMFPPGVAPPLERAQGDEDRETMRQLEMLEGVLNPKGVRFLAGSWSLEKGACRCCLEVRTQEGQVIPALDWLADQKLSDDLLRAVPRDAFYVLAMPLSDRVRSLDVSKTVDRLSATLLGKVQKSSDRESEASEESLPSLSVRELEKKLKVNLGKEVLGRVRTVAVAGGWHARGETEIDGRPVVLIEAASEEAARELEKLWPRLAALGEKQLQPRLVRVREESIHCLKTKANNEEAAGTPCRAMPPYFARCGSVLVLGWEARSVAAAVRAPKDDRPLLNLPRARETAQEDSAGFFGLFSCRQMLRQLCSLMGHDDTSGMAAVTQLRHMSLAMKELPPTVFLVRHEDNRYRCELQQSDLKDAAVPVLNALAQLLQTGIGFQTWVGGMTLPNPKYLEHPPAYAPRQPPDLSSLRPTMPKSSTEEGNTKPPPSEKRQTRECRP